MPRCRALLLAPLVLGAAACIAACGGEGARPAGAAADSGARAALPPAVPVLDTVAPAAGALGPLLARALAHCDGPAADTATDAAPGDTLCWHAERRADLAGDGRPFLVSADARGPRPDSLTVRVRVTRDDTTWYAAHWNTIMYGRYDDERAPPAADSLARRVDVQLARLLADSAFVPVRTVNGAGAGADRSLREALQYDAAEATVRAARRLTSADSLPIDALDATNARLDSAGPRTADAARAATLAAELRDRLAWRFFLGGEHTTGIAWSAAERRFALVYSCC